MRFSQFYTIFGNPIQLPKNKFLGQNEFNDVVFSILLISLINIELSEENFNRILCGQRTKRKKSGCILYWVGFAHYSIMICLHIIYRFNVKNDDSGL